METIKTPFKKMTPRQKLEHIWEYYKPAIFGIAAGIAIIIYIIYKIAVPEPEVILNVTLCNAASVDIAEEDTFWCYLQEHGMDPEEETIQVNSNMYLDKENMNQTSAANMQVLSAMIMVGDIDLLVGDEYVMDLVGGNGGLAPVSELLDETLVEKYHDDLYTVTNPDNGQELVCGIWLPENNSLVADGYYNRRMLAAIPYTAKNSELAQIMLIQLLGE